MTAYKPIVGTPTSKAILQDIQDRIPGISEAQLVENILIEFSYSDIEGFIKRTNVKMEAKKRKSEEAKAIKYRERLAKGKAERAKNKFEKPIAKAAKHSKIKEEPPEDEEEIYVDEVVEEDMDCLVVAGV